MLDHSIPLHSGYTFRTAAILREQRKLGWATHHLTSPKQEDCTVAEEDVDGLHFYRTSPVPALATIKPRPPFHFVLFESRSCVSELFKASCPYQNKLLREYSSMADEFHFRVLDARRSVNKIQDELRKQVHAFLEPPQ